MWSRSHEGMGMDDLAVGAGILGAARVALERLGRPLRGAASRSKASARRAPAPPARSSRAGARVVAVSTIEGAIIDPRGSMSTADRAPGRAR